MKWSAPPGLKSGHSMQENTAKQSIILTNFSYVSCNVHRITLYTCQLNINYCKNVYLEASQLFSLESN